MPAVISAHVVLREKLRESVSHALSLDVRLEGLIAERPSKPGGGFHGKIDFSQPPWHAPVAHAHLDLHALSRKLERDLRQDMDMNPPERGFSGKNTIKALEAVCNLCEGADDFMVRLTTKELEKWSKRASVALEEAEIPKRLPRAPGTPEPKCPFCENHTLRSLSLDGEIFCIKPDCRDENSKKPRARLEFSSHVGDFVLVWQDGIAGVPAA